MNNPSVATFLADAAVLAVWLAVPIVVAAAIGGLVAAMLGYATGLSDAAISLTARLAGVAIALVVFAPSMAKRVVAFTELTFAMFAGAG